MLQIARYSVDQIDSSDSAKELVFGNAESAEELLRSFVTRAFRRPPQEQDITPYLAIYRASRSNGHSHEIAIKDSLVAILTSPNFYRIEGDDSSAASIYQVQSSELAVRLSYFPWSSTPDASLCTRD